MFCLNMGSEITCHNNQRSHWSESQSSIGLLLLVTSCEDVILVFDPCINTFYFDEYLGRNFYHSQLNV